MLTRWTTALIIINTNCIIVETVSSCCWRLESRKQLVIITSTNADYNKYSDNALGYQTKTLVVTSVVYFVREASDQRFSATYTWIFLFLSRIIFIVAVVVFLTHSPTHILTHSFTLTMYMCSEIDR